MFDFLSKKFSGVFDWMKGRKSLDEETLGALLKNMNDILLEADVPQEVANSFLDGIRKKLLNEKVTSKVSLSDYVTKLVHEELTSFLGGDESKKKFKLPKVSLMMGLQGAGKTTTIAKLVKKEIDNGKDGRRILVASVDFNRPAAIEQLETLSKTVRCSFFRSSSSDPETASQEVRNHFQKGNYKNLIIDTAGRMHVDADLMEELKNVSSVFSDGRKYLVLDSMTGQQSLNVANEFNGAVRVDAAILSKMDSDSRGGAAFSVRFACKVPILFVGTGERSSELERFVPSRIASRMLGMGDIETLIERTEKVLDDDDGKNKNKASVDDMLKGKFSLDDFYNQMKMVGKMGSFRKIMKYLPNMPDISDEMIEKGEREMKYFGAIISSMTKKEKVSPALLNSSRKKRIAAGAGVKATEVDNLIQKFEQSRQFAKILGKQGRARW